jgi:hypothetical protein
VTFLRLLAMAVAPESPMLLLSESLHCLHMCKVVTSLRLLAMAVAPYCPMLLSPESLHCLHMVKVVSCLRLLAIAVAPDSPMLLFSESLHCLRMCKEVSCLRFYATNCAPLSPTPKSNYHLVPIPPMLNCCTYGSCMSSTVIFDIVLSALSTVVNPLTVKVLLSPLAFPVAVPRRSWVSCWIRHIC